MMSVENRFFPAKGRLTTASAALVPIITEAGGRFTSLEGEDGPFGGNALATNGLLHPDALESLNPELIGQQQA